MKEWEDCSGGQSSDGELRRLAQPGAVYFLFISVLHLLWGWKYGYDSINFQRTLFTQERTNGSKRARSRRLPTGELTMIAN